MRRLSAMALLLVLTGCGVPASDVIEAGAPARGIPGPAPTEAVAEPATAPLFFLTEGELTAYPRPAGDAADLTSLIRLLLEGPNEKERATSATTDLPRLSEAPSVTLTDGATITVSLPNTSTPVSRTALLQLTCTIHYAATPFVPPSGGHPSGGTPGLRLTGTGWTQTSPTTACPAKPWAETGAFDR
ncbi:hypothetical protein ACPCKL_24980 [Streptomyces cellulosae]